MTTRPNLERNAENAGDENWWSVGWQEKMRCHGILRVLCIPRLNVGAVELEKAGIF